MNSRIVLALAVSAGMALLVTGIFYQIALRGDSSDSQEFGVKEVVVAVNDLGIGSEIKASDLRVQELPATAVPQDAFTKIEEVIERAPSSRILSGEPVLERRLAPPGSGFGLAGKVPEGMRAMAIKVDDVNSVSGFVMPDAAVDVLVTGTPANRSAKGQVTRTILGNVQVLTAGENMEPDASGKPQRVATVTLLVSPEQAEMVTLAQQRGKIQLVLRNSSDEEVVETAGVNEIELYGGRVSSPPPSRKPAKAPVTVKPPAPPPPPPEVQVQVIRGDKISVRSFQDEEAWN